jgi:tetratricopeptide (TPR) repeat protein
MSAPALEPLFDQARAAVRRRDYQTAVDFYRQALELDSTSLEAIEGLGMMLFASGDLAAAIEQFLRLTQLQPMVARHFVNLGAIYNRQGDHQKAADVLRKAIQRDRRCADAYYNLGVAQRKLNQTSMALSSYKEAIRLDPQMAEAYQNLGNIYTEMSSFHLAITNYRKALEIRPDFEKARLGLEKAEDLAEQAKAHANPFGRLVQANAIAPKEIPTLKRQLTEAERQADRQRVCLLAAELEALAQRCSEFLKEKFEPAIITLQKTVADGQFKSMNFLNSAEDFREAFAQWQELRRQVQKKNQELRSHEEMVNTPGMPIH